MIEFTEDVGPLEKLGLWIGIILIATVYVPGAPILIIVIWATILIYLAIQESLGGCNDRRTSANKKGRVENKAA